MKPNRRRVMKSAHKWFADSRRMGLGWTWSRCLKAAWAAEKTRCTQEYRETYWRPWHDTGRKTAGAPRAHAT